MRVSTCHDPRKERIHAFKLSDGALLVSPELNDALLANDLVEGAGRRLFGGVRIMVSNLLPINREKGRV